MNIQLEENDIQRVHHIGKKPLSKKRPIIARVYSMKKRNEFMIGKAKLKNSEMYEKSYKQLRFDLCYYNM